MGGTKKQDKETRYYVDLDLRAQKIIKWDYDQRDRLVGQEPARPSLHRVFLTKGQYNKLVKKDLDLRNEAVSK